MTTYDLTNDVGKVRLNIGDTNTADAVFTDAELTVFLTAEGSVPLASAAALEAWAAKYAANAASEKIGDYAYTQKIVDQMLTVAKRIRDKDASTPAMDWAEWDFTGIEVTT